MYTKCKDIFYGSERGGVFGATTQSLLPPIILLPYSAIYFSQRMSFYSFRRENELCTIGEGEL
jgi:hypothetical protein